MLTIHYGQRYRRWWAFVVCTEIALSALDQFLIDEGAEVLQGFASPITEVKRSFDDSRPALEPES